LTEFQVGREQFVVMSYPVATPDGAAELTQAERIVLRQMLEGMSNAQIAADRGRALRTVINQVASIFAKLGVHSRAELALLFARNVEQS
jgi:DNA-binding CsgD family transcriptional regulator